MNRAAAAVLVVLLTVQGSVAGVLTGDVVGEVANDTTGETSVPDAANATSTAEQSTTMGGAAAANEEAGTDTDSLTENAVGTTTGETTTEAGMASGGENDPETTTDSTESAMTSTETTTSTGTEATEETETAETTETTDSDETESETTESSTDTSASETPMQPPRTPSEGATPSTTRAPPTGGQSPSGSTPPSSGGSEGTAPSQAAGGNSRAGGPPAGAASSAAAAGGSVASPDAEFEVTSVSSDVPVGGMGNVSVTIENTGEDATDAVVSLQSQTGDLRFGQSAATSRFVGEWEGGETRTIEVTARATRGADTDEYPVQTTVSYNDDDGNVSQSAPLTFGVAPASEQGFTLGGVDSDLAAGAEGTISGAITNEGPERATDAVVALSPNGSRAIVPRQPQYVLGDLDADESESFEYPVSVNGTAEPGERQVSFVVQYYDSDGNPLQSRPLNAQIDIDAESDDFDITDVDTDVEAGEQGTLSVTMNNTGESVTDSTVSFQSLSSGILFGQTANASRFVEGWDTGDRRTFAFDVTATDGTTEARYPLQASLSYDDADGDRGRTGPIRFGITPDEDEDDFAVVSSSSEVQVGDEGPVSVTLENRGENVSEATVSLQSLTGDILFGRTANATQFVGEWPAGTQRTVTFNATASNQSETRSYPLQASVSYSDSDDDQGRSGPFTLGITPQPEQSFALGNTSSTLRVGDEGNVTGTITNQGPQDARNAVVELVSESQNIEPQATEVVVGSLPAGGTANFSIPVEVTDSAESGPQQFSFVVEYGNQNGDTRRSGTLDTQVDIGPQRDAFVVERANASLDVGSSGTVTLDVTNNRASTVSNVNAKAFVDTPLSIAGDEAYIAELGPNETQQIAFDVSSGGDASAGQYPLSVDFQYDSGGESKLSDTYEVPVELVEAEDGAILSSLSMLWGLGALLVLFGIGVVWSRRR